MKRTGENGKVMVVALMMIRGDLDRLHCSLLTSRHLRTRLSCFIFLFASMYLTWAVTVSRSALAAGSRKLPSWLTVFFTTRCPALPP